MALVERARMWGFHTVEDSANPAETTLRQVVGGRVLQSVISDREGLAAEVAEIVSGLPH
jgi:regulator of protease activity HflC (stomatin/prohibitin superfamily)